MHIIGWSVGRLVVDIGWSGERSECSYLQISNQGSAADGKMVDCCRNHSTHCVCAAKLLMQAAKYFTIFTPVLNLSTQPSCVCSAKLPTMQTSLYHLQLLCHQNSLKASCISNGDSPCIFSLPQTAIFNFVPQEKHDFSPFPSLWVLGAPESSTLNLMYNPYYEWCMIKWIAPLKAKNGLSMSKDMGALRCVKFFVLNGNIGAFKAFIYLQRVIGKIC